MYSIFRKALICILVLLPLVAKSAPTKISNIVVKITTGKVVNVTTNFPSVLRVKYSLNCGNLNKVASDNIKSVKHEVYINGLNFGTKYCYQIEVKSLKGEIVNSKKEFFITQKFVK